MTTSHDAGTQRLAYRGTFAVLALISHAGLALAQATAGAQPAKATAAPQSDTTRMVGSQFVIIRASNPLIDSLRKRLDRLPLASPVYIATRDSLTAAYKALPTPTGFGATSAGTYNVTVAPTALRVTATDLVPSGWFGFVADGVNESWDTPYGTFLRYFEYPTVVAVEPNSPASRAGVRFGDSLVSYNRNDLVRRPINFTQLLTPGREVVVRVRREGETKDLPIIVAKAPPSVMEQRRRDAAAAMAQAAAQPQVGSRAVIIDSTDRRLIETMRVAGQAAIAVGQPVRSGARTSSGMMSATMVASTGVYGAAIVSINPEAEAGKNIVGLKGRGGVLVTTVPAGSLAERVGLRSLDVILSVDGQSVTNTGQLRVRLQNADQNHADKIKLELLRAGKTTTLTIDSSR